MMTWTTRTETAKRSEGEVVGKQVNTEGMGPSTGIGLALGSAIGVGVGTAAGAALGNLALGTGLGIAVGCSGGLLVAVLSSTKRCDPSKQCVECGYTVEGLEGTVCPECGHERAGDTGGAGGREG